MIIFVVLKIINKISIILLWRNNVFLLFMFKDKYKDKYKGNKGKMGN